MVSEFPNRFKNQHSLPARETYDVSRIEDLYKRMKQNPALMERFIGAAQGRARSIVEQGKLSDYIKLGDIVYYLGTGTGHVAQRIEQTTRAKVYNVDIADLRTPDTKQDSNFVIATARKLPFGDGSATVVVASDMLHHCENQKDIIREAHRVLINDGQLILLEDTMPERDRHPKLRKLIEKIFGKLDDTMNLQKSGVNPHGYRSIQEWHVFMEENGFEVVDVKSWYWGPVDFVPGVKSKEHTKRSLGRPFESTRFVFRKKQTQ